MESNTQDVTMRSLSTSATENYDPRLVKVLIKYPEDFAGKRYFKDGDVREVSPETAQGFVTMGIASFLEANGDPAQTESEQLDEPAKEEVATASKQTTKPNSKQTKK